MYWEQFCYKLEARRASVRAVETYIAFALQHLLADQQSSLRSLHFSYFDFI